MRAIGITCCLFVGLMKIVGLLWCGVRNLAKLLYHSYKYLRDLSEKKAAKANQCGDPKLETEKDTPTIQVNSRRSIEDITYHPSELITASVDTKSTQFVSKDGFNR
ncbi:MULTISPECIES: hypothetical protein [unclassified Enterococcus]|uniref:hypothetical protein n=1 Tax=unclassified Enterococcus TaxID=2608891 RepID=UPI0013EC7F3D|nr:MULTISPECIES: hypothetical protein [unclassified Enterococcus]